MKVRLPRRLALALALLAGILIVPIVIGGIQPASAGPCDLSPDLAPELIGSGVDGLMQAPTAPGTPQAPTTNYEQFGMSGQFWHTYDLGCSDIGAVLGNSWANTIFLWAKAIDRLTITTYQAAATEGPLQSIKDVVDTMVQRLSEAMYWPFLRPIVILGAIWLAWYGLLRKRATTTAEGVIWMILAVTVATWFFSRPQDFTGLGKLVTDKTGEVVNSAFSSLPGAGGASCLPPPGETSPQVKAGGYAQVGTPTVAQNSDALWSTLVCKPWLMGEFGTADANQPVVRDFGRTMLELQSIPAAEVAKGGAPDPAAAQAKYAALAEKLKNDPRFAIFQGKDWTSRLGVAIGALIAACVAGVLIFLVAVSLLVLKVGFLLLLILGPVFLLIGVHPGSGRIIAMRWVEMLVGTLLRQAVLALVLSVLVYGYALIISTAMPWGLQILFMALLTIAVFFYRRPFQHLFASMSGHTLTTRMLGEAASSPVLERSAVSLPPVAAARIGRWGMRKAEPLVAAATGGAAGAAAAAVAQGRVRGEEGEPGTPSGTRVPATPAPLNPDRQGGKAGNRTTAAPRTGAAPPLNLGGTRTAAGASGGPAGAGAGAGAGSVSGGSGGGAVRSGWFGGRSGGGWAPRGGSGTRSAGSGSRGTRSGGSGGLFGGSGSGGSGGSGGSSGRRSGGSGGRGSGSGSGSGGSGRSGGLFGGSGGSGGSRSGSSGGSGSGGGLFGGGGSRDVPSPRSAEPPPLWLPSRGSNGGGGDDPAVPFWLKPSNPDKD